MFSGICGATATMMNELNAVKNLSCYTNMFEYGLSTLHARIRCSECVLHIACRKWRIRDCDKDIVQQTKLDIQEKLRIRMSVLVDIPRPGSGYTNNGNTERGLFQKPNLM